MPTLLLISADHESPRLQSIPPSFKRAQTFPVSLPLSLRLYVCLQFLSIISRKERAASTQHIRTTFVAQTLFVSAEGYLCIFITVNFLMIDFSCSWVRVEDVKKVLQQPMISILACEGGNWSTHKLSRISTFTLQRGNDWLYTISLTIYSWLHMFR